MLKAIIFDMDWVLVKSTGIIRKSFIKVLEEQGINTEVFNTVNKERYQGRTLKDQLQLWETELWIHQSLDVDTFAKQSLTYQLELGKNDFVPNPATLQLIKEAKEKGIKIAVATSSRKERAVILLKLVEVFDTLDACIAYEDITKGKPDPECFLKAAEALNINPENCLVIEDAINGIQAAKTAKMKAVAKINPENISEGFNLADMHFQNFEDISLSDLKNLYF